MKVKNILIALIVISSFTSCQITERIYFEENGSGSYEMEIDMSEMTKAFGAMGEKKKLDSNYVAKDSIIKFSKILVEHKDSIATLSKEKQDRLKRMKDVIMVIHEDKQKNEFSMKIIGIFKNAHELDELQEILNATQSEEKQIPSKAKIKYSFKKNIFTRKSISKDFNQEELEKYNASLKAFSKFIEQTNYSLEYHFSKKIKKTSIEGATFSADKKTLYLEKTIDDLINNPSSLDIKVTLEK